jgi:hypothetical protein
VKLYLNVGFKTRNLLKSNYNIMRKHLVLTTFLLASFVFCVSFATFYVQIEIERGNVCGCTIPIPMFIPMFSSLGILVGSGVYYFLFPKLEKRKASVEVFWKHFLSLLDEDERYVVEKLLNNGGEVLQSIISRELGKVKTFRIVERLEKKGLIEKERYGKTYIIKLGKGLKEFIA